MFRVRGFEFWIIVVFKVNYYSNHYHYLVAIMSKNYHCGGKRDSRLWSRIAPGMREYARVCASMREYARVLVVQSPIASAMKTTLRIVVVIRCIMNSSRVSGSRP